MSENNFSFTDQYTKLVWKRMEDPPGINGRGIFRFNGIPYVSSALNGSLTPLRADMRVRVCYIANLFYNCLFKYTYNGNPVDPRKEKKKPDPFALVEPSQQEGNINLLQTSMPTITDQINASTNSGIPETEAENIIMDNSNAMDMEEGNEDEENGKVKEAKGDDEEGKKLMEEDELKNSDEDGKKKEDGKNPVITIVTEDMLKLDNIMVNIFFIKI